MSELAQADAVPTGPGFDRGAAYVGAQYVPIDEAKVSVLDVGFARSDVTYDVVAVWEGAFFRLEDHLERFERSCRELRLTLKPDRDEIASILMDLVRLTGLREAYVETLCTRGVDRTGVRDPRTFENQFLAYAIPYVWLFRPDDGTTGMDAVITRSVRRIPPVSVDPTVKNFHWGDLTRGLYEAYDRGAHYPILLDYEGNVTEGAGYNVFALVGGRLLTPSSGALEGITRRTVLELARRGHHRGNRAAPRRDIQERDGALRDVDRGRGDARRLARWPACGGRQRRPGHQTASRALLAGTRGSAVHHPGRLLGLGVDERGDR